MASSKNIQDYDVITSTQDTDKLPILDSSDNNYLKLIAKSDLISATGDMAKSVYDTDDDGIVDNSEALEGQVGSYYLARGNHTGTQSADTITDGTTNKAYTATEKTKLSGIETGAEVNNISDINATDLTDAGDSALHYHATDRARANHTGTQAASTISDFDTEVDNNTNVAANTTHRTSNGSDHTYIDQDVTIGSAPAFTGATLTTPTITLKQGLSVTPTGEGDIQWDTDDNKIKVGDGVGTKIFSDDASLSITASQVSDFDTEVSNNTDVTANTSARHSAVTLSGTPDYITLVGQDIVRGQVDLTTDVTGVLPNANVADDITLTNITQITNRSHTSLSDIGTNTHAQIDTHIASTSNPHSVTEVQVLPSQTGNSGKYLTTDGTNSSWATVAAGSSPLTTKGDIYTYDTADARLPVGTNGQVLSADSTTATGLKWVAAGGTGTVTSVSAGNGMDFTTITTTGSVTMGTPGTVTAASTNAVTATSHTHALDESGISITASQVSDFDTEVANNTDVAANTAARHSAVTVLDSAEIDFTLTGQQITASLIAGSIDETKLDVSTNASLDLADSSVQPGDIGTIASQNSNNVTITGGSITGITDLAIADGGTGASTAATAFSNLKQTASTTATGVVERATDAEFTTGTDTTRYVTADQTASVAQTLTNKTLTSPVINTSISGTAFKDEDDMVSNSATSVASQQSIKMYSDGLYNKSVQDKLYSNALINGDFQVWQRGTTFTSATTPANNDDTYLADRWVLLSDGNDVVDVSRYNEAPASSKYSIGLDVETSARFGIAQILEHLDTSRLNDKSVSLSFDVMSPNITDVRAAVLSWGGTSDSVTSDLVATWGATPTWATNWTAENTPSDITVTSSWNRVSIENISIDSATVNNLAVFIWVPNLETVTDIIYITNVQLNVGAEAVDYMPRRYQTELDMCRRYCTVFGGTEDTGTDAFKPVPGWFSGVNTTNIVGIAHLPVRMRVEPTLTTIGSHRVTDFNSATAVTGISVAGSQAGTDAIQLSVTVGSSGVAFRPYALQQANDVDAALIFDAEL